MAADDIDRQIVALDRAPLFGLGVVFAPVPGVRAIDGLDCLSGPDSGAVEGGRGYLAGDNTPCSVTREGHFNARFYWVFEGVLTRSGYRGGGRACETREMIVIAGKFAAALPTTANLLVHDIAGHRAFADEAAVQIEARMAALGAERLPRV